MFLQGNVLETMPYEFQTFRNSTHLEKFLSKDFKTLKNFYELIPSFYSTLHNHSEDPEKHDCTPSILFLQISAAV